MTGTPHWPDGSTGPRYPCAVAFVRSGETQHGCPYIGATQQHAPCEAAGCPASLRAVAR